MLGEEAEGEHAEPEEVPVGDGTDQVVRDEEAKPERVGDSLDQREEGRGGDRCKESCQSRLQVGEEVRRKVGVR
jgi:hypothetical protein